MDYYPLLLIHRHVNKHFNGCFKISDFRLHFFGLLDFSVRARVSQRHRLDVQREGAKPQTLRPWRIALLDGQLAHLRHALPVARLAATHAVPKVLLASQQEIFLLLRRIHGDSQRVCQKIHIYE